MGDKLTEMLKKVRQIEIRTNRHVSDALAGAYRSLFKGRGMDFEEAARLRDQVVKLRAQVEGSSEDDVLKSLKKSARKGSAYGNRKHAAYGSSRSS